MQAKITYNFSAKLWRSTEQGGWYFVSIPDTISKEIRENLQWQEEGWGRMKATAIIEKLEWETAIWFDKKTENYLLPLKAAIRKKGRLKLDDVIAVSVLL